MCVVKHYGSEENLRYRQSGMYAPNSAPSRTAPGYGHSHIDFGDLEFQVSPGVLSMNYPGAVTYIEVAVFESSHFDEIGIDVKGATTRQYCCTPWVANRTNCHPSRGLIRNIDPAGHSTNGSIGMESFYFILLHMFTSPTPPPLLLAIVMATFKYARSSDKVCYT
jgi:hypothetical protein